MAKRTNTTYESKTSDIDDLESLAERLTASLQDNIRKIQWTDVLSEKWMETAELMGRIANISEQEAKLPKEKKNATLWETEEIALRYVLEDGKLNLLLRMLVEFRKVQTRSFDTMQAMADAGDQDKQFQVLKMEQFEKGIGVVLRNAWTHIEAIQTTDMHLLMEFIGEVLEDGAKRPNPKLERYVKDASAAERQEVIALYYLRGIVKALGDDESKYMPMVQRQRIIPRLAIFLDAHKDDGLLPFDDLLCGFQALSGLLATEDFATYDEDILSGDEGKSALVNLQPALEVYLDDRDFRSSIKPLADYISDLRRDFGGGYK